MQKAQAAKLNENLKRPVQPLRNDKRNLLKIKENRPGLSYITVHIHHTELRYDKFMKGLRGLMKCWTVEVESIRNGSLDACHLKQFCFITGSEINLEQ